MSNHPTKTILARPSELLLIGGDEAGGHLLSKDEARRIPVNIAKLSQLLQKT